MVVDLYLLYQMIWKKDTIEIENIAVLHHNVQR